MALNANTLKGLLVSGVRSLHSQITTTFIPDFLAKMSEIISDYLSSNMELEVSWVAMSTTTPSTPDPVLTFNARVTPFQLGLSRSLIQGMTSPTAINLALNTAYKTAISSVMINAAQTGEYSLTPIPLSPLATTASIKFGDKNNSGSDAFEKNMETLANSVVNGIVGPILVPGLTGNHNDVYFSTGTSSIVGIS